MSSEFEDVREGFEKLAAAAERTNAQFVTGANLIVDALLKGRESVAQSIADMKADIARGSRTSAKPRRRPL